MTAARDGSPPPKAFLGRRCIAFGREKEVDRRTDSGWMRPLSCFTHWPQIHCSSIAIIFSIHGRWQTFHFSRNFGRIERNTHNAIGISERPGSVALPTDRLEIRERYSLMPADFDSLVSRRSPSRPKNHHLPRSSTDMRSSMSRVCKPVASCPYLSELAVGFQLFVFPWDARYLRNYHLRNSRNIAGRRNFDASPRKVSVTR